MAAASWLRPSRSVRLSRWSVTGRSSGEGQRRDATRTAGVAEPAVSLHEQKQDLRDLHRLLVAGVARTSGIDHRRLNAELIARTGSRVDQATAEQLRKRIQLLERWKERGYDGKR